MQRFLSGLLCLTLASAALPELAGGQTPYADRVREHTLPNGLEVLLMEDHKAPVAVFQLWYRVGSRNESLGQTGLSHVLEHMMFKGTTELASDEYSRIIKENGGDENAFTTADATAYFAKLASDRLDIEIELEADRMHNLAFAEEEFFPELKVVMEERRLRTGDKPVAELFEKMRATAYIAHPYQWPVIGWMNDLRQLSREDALAYYKTHYGPGNAVAIAVGDFDGDALLEKIQAEFGNVPAMPPPPIVRAIEPPQSGERRTKLRRPAELPFIAYAYHVPNVHHTDAHALEVLSAVLAGGKSSRLHQDLVYEKRLARSAGASYDMTSVDPGLFYLHAQPLPGKSVDSLAIELDAQLEKLRNEPVSQRELEKVRRSLEADFLFAQDSLFYQAMLLGQYEMAGNWKLFDDYLPGVRSVTAADIQRVVNTYFVPTNRTVGILEPS